LRERRNRKQRARLITLLAVITAAGNFRLAQVLQQARYSSRLGLEGCGICSLFGAVGVVCAPIDRWPHPPPDQARLPGWPSTMATRELAAEPETWPALSPSSSLVTTRRSPSYPYVAGPVDLAGMVTPDRFAPGTAAGEALKFVSQWA